MGQEWCLSVSEEVDQRALRYTIDRNTKILENIYLDISMTKVGKLLYTHSIKYYRATKTNGTLTHRLSLQT